MLSIRDVSYNIKEIDKLYTKAKSNRKSNLYAKLAVLEACGWIEECSDKIATELKDNNLTSKDNKDYYEKIIDETWGFEYNAELSRSPVGAYRS